MYVMIAVKKELYNELVIVSWVQGLFGYLQTDGEKKSHTLFCFFLAFLVRFFVAFFAFLLLPLLPVKIQDYFDSTAKQQPKRKCVTKNVYVKNAYICLVHESCLEKCSHSNFDVKRSFDKRTYINGLRSLYMAKKTRVLTCLTRSNVHTLFI